MTNVRGYIWSSRRPMPSHMGRWHFLPLYRSNASLRVPNCPCGPQSDSARFMSTIP